jgi:hypothetical protein
MTGTSSQIAWAEQIKIRVAAEFGRVTNALEKVAARQSEHDRAETSAIIAIVQHIRFEVMAKDEAGYFIRDWQELGDQVRRMIGQDPAYKAIKIRREARSRQTRSDRLLGEIGRTE